MSEPEKKVDSAASFVGMAITRIKQDGAFRAALKRADNPETESAAWEYLTPYCDITRDWERLPYCTVGAAIARSKASANGKFGIGEALRQICPEDADRETPRLRRLIACDTADELFPVTRQILTYLAAKEITVDYIRLLRELLTYDLYRDDIRLRWTAQYFKAEKPKETDEGADN